MIAGIAGVAGGEDPELEQELENPQLYPTPVPVRPFTLPAVDLAAEELDIGTAALLGLVFGESNDRAREAAIH